MRVRGEKVEEGTAGPPPGQFGEEQGESSARPFGVKAKPKRGGADLDSPREIHILLDDIKAVAAQHEADDTEGVIQVWEQTSMDIDGFSNLDKLTEDSLPTGPQVDLKLNLAVVFVENRDEADQTKWIDLSSTEFANVTGKGLEEVFTLCPEPEAIFATPCASAIVAEIVDCRPPIFMLGCEISADTYISMVAQLRDTHMLDLTGAAFGQLSDAGIAELTNIPDLNLKETLQAVFTDPANGKVTEAAMLQLQQQCGSQCKCVLLGRDITLDEYQMLLHDTQSLDSQDFLARVTGAGSIKELWAIQAQKMAKANEEMAKAQKLQREAEQAAQAA